MEAREDSWIPACAGMTGEVWAWASDKIENKKVGIRNRPIKIGVRRCA